MKRKEGVKEQEREQRSEGGRSEKVRERGREKKGSKGAREGRGGRVDGKGVKEEGG